MSVVLIFNQEGFGDRPFVERIEAVVLPSRKVLTKTEDESISKVISKYEDRWNEEPDLRESIAESSKKFFEENFDGEIPPPDENDKDFPLAAFYWMVLSNFDNQAVSSEIYADDDAKDILREGGWFE